MNLQEALSILDVGQPIDIKLVTRKYRHLASKYHPDKNKHGLEMMKLVNQARDIVVQASNYQPKQSSSSNHQQSKTQTGRNMWENLGLATCTIDGRAYVWGATFPHRELLKQHGYRWEPDKKRWWKFV